MAGKIPPQFMKGGKSPAKPNPFAGKGAPAFGGKKPAMPAGVPAKMAKGETGMGPAFKKGGKVGMKGKC